MSLTRIAISSATLGSFFSRSTSPRSFGRAPGGSWVVTVCVNAVLPGTTRDVLVLDDVPGGLEPFGRRGDVVGEGAIPALDERDAPVLLPVVADAVGDRPPPFQAAAS